MDSSILEKIVGLSNKLADIQKQLADPAVMADMKRYVQLNKEYKELGPVVKAGTKYQKMVEDYNSAKDILQNEKDDELREMAKDELASLEEKLPVMEEEIRLLLIPADPEDSKDAIVEIRGGTGGDEAAIFAGEDYAAALVSTIGPHIYNPFCRAHNFHVVLYHNYAVATLYEGIYGVDKVLYIM